MVKEIYIRTENDPYFQEGVIDYSNEIESLITQIRVLLGTSNGDVMGTHTFGLNLEYLVFKTIKSSFDIKEKLDEQISRYVYVSPNIDLKTEINFGKDEHGYDYAVVDIIINGVKSVGFLVNRD